MKDCKLCARLDGREVWGQTDTCTYVYMGKSLCCSPETPTILLIHYTPIKNVLGVKNMLFFKKKERIIEVAVD